MVLGLWYIKSMNKEPKGTYKVYVTLPYGYGPAYVRDALALIFEDVEYTWSHDETSFVVCGSNKESIKIK